MIINLRIINYKIIKSSYVKLIRIYYFEKIDYTIFITIKRNNLKLKKKQMWDMQVLFLVCVLNLVIVKAIQNLQSKIIFVI